MEEKIKALIHKLSLIKKFTREDKLYSWESQVDIAEEIMDKEDGDFSEFTKIFQSLGKKGKSFRKGIASIISSIILLSSGSWSARLASSRENVDYKINVILLFPFGSANPGYNIHVISGKRFKKATFITSIDELKLIVDEDIDECSSRILCKGECATEAEKKFLQMQQGRILKSLENWKILSSYKETNKKPAFLYLPYDLTTSKKDWTEMSDDVVSSILS